MWQIVGYPRQKSTFHQQPAHSRNRHSNQQQSITSEAPTDAQLQKHSTKTLFRPILTRELESRTSPFWKLIMKLARVINRKQENRSSILLLDYLKLDFVKWNKPIIWSWVRLVLIVNLRCNWQALYLYRIIVNLQNIEYCHHSVWRVWEHSYEPSLYWVLSFNKSTNRSNCGLS